ncbi:MAG: hypothetical protein IKJ15_00760 [Lachnospiraceae bacterium]|nr:hypothetical protein [Lachnospiraceae bacterium]
MKKRFFFDLVTLIAIAAGFFVLLHFQDLGIDFLDNLKGKDKNIETEQSVIQNDEYLHVQKPEEDKHSTMEKQEFVQPEKEELTNCYCYSVLNDEEKQIYEEIYSIIKNMEKDVELSTLDVELIEKVFKCVLNDNPQFYYIEGYTYTTYSKQDVISKLEFSGTYSKTKEECKTIDAGIENYVAGCFGQMPEGLSDYEKVKYIYEYIIESTEYNLGAEDSQNICSVFLNGESVCMGYAKAMQYLLLKQDILCTIVNGTAQEGEEHAWNLLLLDGQYYHLDVTWGDDSYTVANGDDSGVGMTNYSFFCVTTEEISQTHTIENVVELPECTANENNYYVKEGYYFKDLDTDKLAAIFDEAYSEGKGYVEIKCMDAVVYRKIYTYLIEEQHIFEYLKEDKDTVSYYDGEELLLLEFWLK